MEPTKERISQLTRQQREAIQKMQKEGVVVPDPGSAMKTHNCLVRIGIAECHTLTNGKIAFRLLPEWKAVDVARRSLEHIKRERRAARQAMIAACPRERESPIIPDAPKVIQRPKACYGNPSWEERIAKIMNA